MLYFKPIELGDRQILEPILRQTPYLSCNYNFIGFILWNNVYPTYYTFVNDILVTASMTHDNNLVYNFPPTEVKDDNLKDTINQLIDNSKQQNQPFMMDRISIDMKDTLERIFPNTFDFRELTYQNEYIYNVSDLIELKGSKYQPKRNHIYQFERNYEYEYSSIQTEDIPDCIDLLLQWNKKHGCGATQCGLRGDICTAMSALENFVEYNLSGGLIRIDNKVAAFSIGQQINDIIFDNMFEKGLDDYTGIYSMINQQFAEHELPDFKYVNREEDLDIEGLRKSKMSYFPAILLVNHSATLK